MLQIWLCVPHRADIRPLWRLIIWLKCGFLQILTAPGAPPTGEPNFYEYVVSNSILYVPDDEAVIEAYKNSDLWKDWFIRPVSDFGHVNKINLRSDSVTLNVADTVELSASTNYDAVNRRLTWSSSDESVVTVKYDVSGGYCPIAAIAPGEADITISAADGFGATVTCHVTVQATENAIHNIENSSVQIKTDGASLTLTTDAQANVAIYTIGGVQVTNFTLTSGSRTVPLAQGLYLVAVNGQATKVAVK